MAARSAVQLSGTTTQVLPVTKKKSAKSSKIHDQLEVGVVETTKSPTRITTAVTERKTLHGVTSFKTRQNRTAQSQGRSSSKLPCNHNDRL